MRESRLGKLAKVNQIQTIWVYNYDMLRMAN
jgi:hypothetical protein